jgi:hypothetical protein
MKMSKTRIPAQPSTTVHAYSTAGIEPTIAEVLAEPIVRTLMKRDAISEATLVRVIANARAQLAERRAA